MLTQIEEMIKRNKNVRLDSVLVVDLNNIVYKAVHVNPELTYKGVFTGGLYGVLSQIENKIWRFETTKIVVCDDSPPYLRSHLVGSYKKKKKKELNLLIQKTKELCYALFKKLNISIWIQKGLEADDLISMIANKEIQNINASNIYILSSDSDLFQCLRPGVSLVGRKDIVLYDFFREKYGIMPRQWPWVIALSGGHNCIPGFKGVGEKKALKIVKDEKTFFEFLFKNPVALLYYQAAKLPLFVMNKDKKLKITSPDNHNLDDAKTFLRDLGFRIKG